MKFKKLYPLLVIVSLVLFSCKEKIKEDNEQKVGTGGTFDVAFEIGPKTVNPRSIIDFYSATAALQIYEGLVKFNPRTLKPEAAIAKDYEMLNNSTMFKFTLRDDVKFHDNDIFENGKGRNVTASDVKKSFEYYCNPNIKGDAIAYLSIFKNTVKGADEYYKGIAKEISGIQVKGNTVTIELLYSDVNFINKLCMVHACIVPSEAISNESVHKGVGSGPFILKKMGDEKILFVKNNQYYGKNELGEQLPILDSLIFHINDDKEEQLAMFQDEKLDVLLGLPPHKIVEVLNQNIKDFTNDPPKYELSGVPELSTSYITVNLVKPYLKDVKVRKAISLAINKEVIIRDDLKNQAYSADGTYGITPPLPIIKNYDFEGIKEVSSNFNPDFAKKLLAEAGYPDGEGFPSLRLEFVESSINSKVANSIMEQLRKNLNINIQIESVSFEQKMNDESAGLGDLYLDAWIADYASPQTFLSNYFGETLPDNDTDLSPVNVSRFRNAEFDKEYTLAKSTVDVKERLNHFANAEKILMSQAAVVVLWYAEEHKIMHSNVRELKPNALKLLNFSNVYFKKRVAGEKKVKKK